MGLGAGCGTDDSDDPQTVTDAAAENQSPDGAAPDAAVESGEDAPDPCSTGACALPPSLPHDQTPATTDEGGPLHPDGFLGDPTVLFEGGRYRMWFTSSRQELSCSGEWWECLVQGFAYAESADGETWDDSWLAPDDPEARTKLVFEPAPGGWERHGMETASVLRGHDGRLWMYYTGHLGAADPSYPFWDAIGVAFSDDGITWTPAAAPVFEAELGWERMCCDASCSCRWGGVLEPSVIYDSETGQYRMWYVGFGDVDGIATYRVGHATSADGLSWHRESGPVLDVGLPDEWDEFWVSHVDVVADPCGGYHLFYQGGGAWSEAACAGGGCVGFTPGAIGAAFSSDGVTWEKRTEPVLEPEAGAWDGFFLGGPDALLRDGRLELFYFGNRDIESADAFDSEIGRTETDCN